MPAWRPAHAGGGGRCLVRTGRTNRCQDFVPNPSVSIDTENALGSGPYRGFGESDTTIAFSMPVELGGKRSARVAVADAEDPARRDRPCHRRGGPPRGGDRGLCRGDRVRTARRGRRGAGGGNDRKPAYRARPRDGRRRTRRSTSSGRRWNRSARPPMPKPPRARQRRRVVTLAHYVGDDAGSALDQRWFDLAATRGQGPALPVDAPRYVGARGRIRRCECGRGRSCVWHAASAYPT